jgi:hypothetical protein
MAVQRDTDRPALLTTLVAWVVLALTAVATLYTAWIAVANFGRIGV